MADDVKRELNCSLEVIFTSVDIVIIEGGMSRGRDRMRIGEGWSAVDVKELAKYICHQPLRN